MFMKTAHYRRTLAIALLAALWMGLGWTTQVQAQSTAQPVVVTLFWGEGCPHCAKAKLALEGLQENYPTLQLDFFEVYNSATNLALMRETAEKYGFQAPGVPLIFIGDQYWIGWSDTIQKEVEQAIKDGVKGKTTIVTVEGDMISLPLIGQINLQNQSSLVSTLLIALIDGVNPCSVWVLSMLLALTLHTGSRKKVFAIGLIFLTITAFVYALFITGLFTILKIASFTKWIQVIVAFISLFFAIVNIKDYFWYKEGVSFTINESKKPGIFQRMRRVIDASESFWGMAGATAVLAAGVSLVEFSCTAGFPVLWTNLLTAQQVAPLVFLGLLLVYMIIYQLDEMAIFFTAVFSLKASKLEEKHGRILKLIGGMLMLTLAIVMLIRPSLMSDLRQSLIVFAVAFGATLLVLLLHRRILPSYGVWIGSEKKTHKRVALKRYH